MENTITNYGSLLKSISCKKNYSNGNIKICRLNKINIIETMYGPLIPQYDFSSEEYTKYKDSLCFYENGALKGIRLQNQTNIKTPVGTLPAKLITLYESGSIKSLELSKPSLISTPIGIITTSISDTLNLNYDMGSVNFYECGNLKSLVTSSDKVTVFLENDDTIIYEPTLKINTIDKKYVEIIPLNISFHDNKIQFNNCEDDEYDLYHCNFVIEHLTFKHSLPYKNH